MSEDEPEYRVGKGKPPLATRFRKGQSGNPAGGRRRRPRDQRLAALIAAALDAKATGAKAPGANERGSGRGRLTRRHAIIEGLIEKSACGDLRAAKLLFDLVLKIELAAPPPDLDEEDPRAFLIRELDRLAAAQSGEPTE